MVSLNAWEPVTLCQCQRLHLVCSHFDLKRSTASSQDWTTEQERQLLLFHLTRSAFLPPCCQSQHQVIASHRSTQIPHSSNGSSCNVEKNALTSKVYLFFQFGPGIPEITTRHERWNVKDSENPSDSKQTNGLGLTFPVITRGVYGDSIFSFFKKMYFT